MRRFSTVQGAGLWVALIIARDPLTGASAPNGPQFGRKLHEVGRRHGLLLRPYAGHILLGPPLTITPAEVDDLVKRLDDTIAETLSIIRPVLPAGHVKRSY